jgi:hypothetical protein
MSRVLAIGKRAIPLADSRIVIHTDYKRMKNKSMRTLLSIATLLAVSGGPLAAAHAQYSVTNDGHIAMDGATDWNGLDNAGLETIVGYSLWEVGERRADIIEQAMGQDDVGECGVEAHRTYDAEPGSAWCSEYARWVYLEAGVPVEACTPGLPDDAGQISTYSCYALRDVTTVQSLIGYFISVVGWSEPGYFQPGDVKPGDYVALTTDGEAFNHSALILAISDDYRYIWTSEGNFDDCVRFNRRDFFVDGQLNPDINGVGNVDALFKAKAQPQ